MTHADEGTLRAWLDGELDAAEARRIDDRMNEDPETRDALQRIRGRESRVGALLATLDADGTEPAERVRAVLRAVRTSSPRRVTAPPGEGDHARFRGSARARNTLPWARGRRLAQAAVLVLLFAGAAAAAITPGSPVRSWLTGALGLGSAPEAAPPAATDAPERDVAGGLIVAPGHDRFEVDLVGVPEGAEIQVTMVPGDTAAVYAPAGSDYEWDADIGRARAEVGGGPIRLELPASVDIDLVVNDRVYLTRRGDRTDVRVSPTYRSPTEIRFRVGS
jgi:hypothetical protein